MMYAIGLFTSLDLLLSLFNILGGCAWLLTMLLALTIPSTTNLPPFFDFDTPHPRQPNHLRVQVARCEAT